MPCCGNHQHKDHCCGNHQHGEHVHESQPEVKQPYEKAGKETDKAAGSRQSH